MFWTSEIIPIKDWKRLSTKKSLRQLIDELQETIKELEAKFETKDDKKKKYLSETKDYTKRLATKRKQKKKQPMKFKSGKKILLTKPLKKKV